VFRFGSNFEVQAFGVRTGAQGATVRIARRTMNTNREPRNREG